eukprot:CFRG2514T1
MPSTERVRLIDSAADRRVSRASSPRHTSSYERPQSDKTRRTKKKKKKRFPLGLPFDILPPVILFHICLLTFGSYWVYDTPGAIQTQLTEWFGGEEHYTNAMNLNLYSVYSYPNIVLSLVGGYLIDGYLGIRTSAVVFCGLISIGQLIFSVGVEARMYWLCLLGRFVFGLGGESLTVSQNAYTVRWFDGKYLSLCFAIVLCASRLGSSVNFIVTPMLANEGVPFSIWTGTLMCLISMVACLSLTVIDYWGEDRVKADVVEEKVSLKHILRLPWATWLNFAVCFTFYIGILTFYAVASDIMQKTGQHYDPQTASFFLAIPNFTSVFAFPIVGYLVDKQGRALYWCAAASLMLLVAHVVFLGNANDWFQIHPVFPMVWLGIAYAMGASAMWPMVSYILPNHILGTAYGTMTAVQNLGTSMAPQLIGYIQDFPYIKGTPKQFTVPITLFIVCAFSAFILTLMLMVEDKRSCCGRLNASSLERSKLPEPDFMLSSTDETELTKDIDIEHSLGLPSMMVGSVFLAKPTNTVRHGYLSKLGIQPSDVESMSSYNAMMSDSSNASSPMCSPSPSQPRSPYIYGSVSSET